MELESIMDAELTFCKLDGISKKRLLEYSSELIADKVDELSATEIFEALLAREELGSTGLGNGIAIPHCRVPKCQQTIGCLITLKDGIDFDAIDHNPVDILFFLLVPEDAIEGHLDVLRTLAEKFSKIDYCKKLRACESNEQLYSIAQQA